MKLAQRREVLTSTHLSVTAATRNVSAATKNPADQKQSADSTAYTSCATVLSGGYRLRVNKQLDMSCCIPLYGPVQPNSAPASTTLSPTIDRFQKTERVPETRTSTSLTADVFCQREADWIDTHKSKYSNSPIARKSVLLG